MTWTNVAHVFIPMCTVMLNKVFANPGGKLRSLQRTLCLHAAAPALRQRVFTVQIIWPGPLWDVFGGGVLCIGEGAQLAHTKRNRIGRSQ